jgi:preprotein translocase subunit YajC
MLNLLFSSALATEAAPAVALQGNPIMSILPIIVLIAVFYFFIIRPQSKRAKEEAKMRNSLRLGDKIVTTSGIFGSVIQIDDKKNVLSIEISKGVNITIYKTSIAEVLLPNLQTKEKNLLEDDKKNNSRSEKNNDDKTGQRSEN